YTTIATGDSYNDTTMLGAAHAGFLFRAPQRVQDEFDFLALEEYPDLLQNIRSAFAELNS
ncbi:MAG: bifunctional phosphoserine phosphatase/homoserine phosphotransferase ThrH, partial [Ilumatobacteraceae bacterium]